jgi:hypothetical protein
LSDAVTENANRFFALIDTGRTKKYDGIVKDKAIFWKLTKKLFFTKCQENQCNFLKYFDPLQAIEFKTPWAGNCCQHAIFYPDNAGLNYHFFDTGYLL